MKWIEWARELQAISQTGLHYATGQFDRERYRRIEAISSEILANYTNLSVDEFLKFNAAEFGYATPKVDVRGVIFKNAKILLVREIADRGRWTLPGGWADVNETPSESVIREVFEESGFETRVVKLLAAYDREKQQHPPAFPYHVYKLFFHCEIVGGNAKVSNETSEIAFFGEAEIPELSESRVKKEQISRFFKLYQKPNSPTEFD
ncbi:putative ADP-ribose pyrophosphatase YjhB [Hyella patelloides LEGE 07179]|uniref:Putative ADP-ribose pyrophosphatase YjhB n=1 Tax=Hyella patelloides LEGE 07179 TaxID=945734 RepID=A0A563W1X2_9CYAN|nr:NUDIX hydrolase [Hyella patelloides]VEP17635.1 putative ADP-ribose pyrophosphatase YjhB [Hyella patelloides LEGE 07179]